MGLSVYPQGRTVQVDCWPFHGKVERYWLSEPTEKCTVEVCRRKVSTLRGNFREQGVGVGNHRMSRNDYIIYGSEVVNKSPSSSVGFADW